MNRIFMFAVSVAAAYAALPASAQTPLALFPLSKGTKWTLAVKVGGQQMVQNVTVSNVKTSGGAKIATVDYKANGMLVQTEQYRIDNKGISRVQAGSAAGSGVLTPPVLVLPANLKSGTKWKWKGTVNMQGQIIPGSADFTLTGPENVSVPAGKFKAYRVQFLLTMNAGAGGKATIENSYWFASNVGMVKQEAKIGPQTITGVLTKYNVVK